jgi:hypothetical protein
MQTVDQLEQLGIRDVNVWRPLNRVAQKLVALQSATPPNV